MLIAAPTFSPVLARRVRPGNVIAIGLGVQVIGYLLLTLVDSTSGLPLLIAGASYVTAATPARLIQPVTALLSPVAAPPSHGRPAPSHDQRLGAIAAESGRCRTHLPITTTPAPACGGKPST